MKCVKVGTFSEVIRKKHNLEVYANCVQCELTPHCCFIVVEPHSTRDIEILFKLIFKVPVVGITADTPNPPGLLPFFKGNLGVPTGQRKFGPSGV